ncbi:MAG: hypothetical protein SFU85_02475 [Candidatus Methylacidiphilales bacterium]|nr:hypothetical protein [Candidatus Methylacidiphilales bacterium]
MKSDRKPVDAAQAVAALEAWFATVTSDAGVTGPALGIRANCLGWCGPAHDWRLEGLIEGRILRHQATGDPTHLDFLEITLRHLIAAQLGDGSFRNSYFEYNPFEGGMPHEPAVLASALRARTVLASANRAVPGLAEAVTRALDGRHLRLLWNKTLHTVRDWEISDYQFGPSISAAAVLDLILEWTAWQGEWERYQERASQLAAWIRGLQETSGSMAGGIHTSNRRGGGISPFYSARCLGPLHRYAQRTGCTETKTSITNLVAFLHRQQLPEGGFRRLLWNWRPASANPLHLGTSAAILHALHPFQSLSAEDLARQQAWLLSHATPSGAFRAALGHGRLHHGSGTGTSDWRDWMPSPGWQDKIYLFFCQLAPASKERFDPQPWSTPTTVRHASGFYTETPDDITVQRGRDTVYHWKKKTQVPDLCRLT